MLHEGDDDPSGNQVDFVLSCTCRVFGFMKKNGLLVSSFLLQFHLSEPPELQLFVSAQAKRTYRKEALLTRQRAAEERLPTFQGSKYIAGDPHPQ